MPEELQSNLAYIRNLIFTPCGVAGIAYAGAIKKLEEEQALSHLENSAGISSGSYAALIVALGYDSETMEKILAEKDFKDFSTLSRKAIRKLFFGEARSQFGFGKSYKGIFDGAPLRLWAQQVLLQRTGEGELTFSELKQYRDMANAAGEMSRGIPSTEANKARRFFQSRVEKALFNKEAHIKHYKLSNDFMFDFEKGAQTTEDMVDNLIQISRGFKNFYTLAAEIINPQEAEDFSKRYKPFYMDAYNTPKLRIAQGIRLSASYPIWFRNGALQDNPHADERRFTDGALVDQFPTHLFDSEGHQSQNTLIFDTSYSKNKISDPTSEKSLLQKAFEALTRRYFGKTMIKRIEEHSEKIGRDAEASEILGIRKRMIRIDRGNVEPTNFNISKAVQHRLVENGYQAVTEAINTFKDKKPHQWANRLRPVYTSLSHWVNLKVPFDRDTGQGI